MLSFFDSFHKSPVSLWATGVTGKLFCQSKCSQMLGEISVLLKSDAMGFTQDNI